VSTAGWMVHAFLDISIGYVDQHKLLAANYAASQEFYIRTGSRAWACHGARTAVCSSCALQLSFSW
jgi:hypothetical protein